MYRLLEVNGKLVLTKTKEDMLRLLAVTPDPALLVVMRTRPSSSASLLSTTAIIHQHDHSRELLLLREELGTLRGRAEDAERAKDSFRSDNLRLTHRISYLEEQVAELLQRTTQEETLSHTVTQSALTSSSNGSMKGLNSTNTPVKASAGKSDVQVFQKGPQVTALVANLPGLEVGSSSPAESRHSLPTLRPKPNATNASSGGTMHHYTVMKNQDVHSTKSLDFGSDCSSSRGITHHHRQEKHSHHRHHHHHLQNARSTNSLDMNKSDATSTLQPKTKHHSHHRLYEATRPAKTGERSAYDYNSETSSVIAHSKHYHRRHSEGHHQQSESHQLLPDMKPNLDCTSELPSGTQQVHKLRDARSVKSLDFDSETSSTNQHYTHERNHHSHSSSHNNHDTQSTRSLDYGSEPTSHTFRNYKKNHDYHNGNSSCTESKPQRPTPPKKPLRLSLHRATSLQSVSATPQTPPAPADYTQGSKKPTKRNHKGEAPPTPAAVQINKEPPQPPPRTPSRAESCQSALRWPSPAAALHQAVTLKTARNGTRLLGANTDEKWC
jgi:sulfur dioxygenase